MKTPLSYEFKEYVDEWKKDGEPCSLGWHKPDCHAFS